MKIQSKERIAAHLEREAEKLSKSAGIPMDPDDVIALILSLDIAQQEAGNPTITDAFLYQGKADPDCKA